VQAFIKDIIDNFAKAVIEGIKENIRSKQVSSFGVAHSSGQAEDSLFYRLEGNNLIIGSTWKYITVLEDGRKPGKFAPPEAIEKWIDEKPIQVGPGQTKKGLAYIINKKLKEEGSLIWRQGGESGILSEFLNAEYIRENLTEKLKDEVVAQASGLLFG
jgi:hypothetical protein